MFGFVARRVRSKILGIGAAGSSWGKVKTIKSGKRSSISSDVSEKQIIVYTSACIKSGRIARSESDYIIDECYPRHIFDDDDEDFVNQLENGVLTRI